MARIYKTKLKEAEQIVDENATQAPAVQATPAEMEQAQAPVDTQLTDPAVDTDLASADAVLPEGTESVDQEVQVNPETVSVEMQIPTDQLAAAVAQATGDVQPAEIAPDTLEAQEGEAAPLVAQEDTDVIGVEGEDAAANAGLDNTQPATITEATDVHSNPGYKVAKETEEKLNDLIDAGVKNTAEDLKRELKTGDDKMKESEEGCTSCEDETLEENKLTESEDEVKDDVEEDKESEEVNVPIDDDIDAIKASGTDESAVDLGDEKLDFSKLDGGEDENNSNLPGGFEDDSDLGNGGMDTSIFDDLDNEEEGLTDIMGRLDGILGDKEEAAQVADSLRASADVIDAISGNDSADKVVDTDSDDDSEDEDAYLLSSLLDDDEEPLDFDKISDFGYDDESDDEDDEEDFKDVFGDDDELDEDYDDFDNEGDDDFEESNARIPVKFPEKKVMREQRAPEPKPETKTLKEAFGDGIVYPAGSGPDVPASEPLVSSRENLVEAHERAVEARRNAINRFRESIKKEKAESNNRFREALRSSVRISRESSSNSNSWSNNQFIDKYQESQKLDFSKLFDNGFLG